MNMHKFCSYQAHKSEFKNFKKEKGGDLYCVEVLGVL